MFPPWIKYQLYDGPPQARLTRLWYARVDREPKNGCRYLPGQPRRPPAPAANKRTALGDPPDVEPVPATDSHAPADYHGSDGLLTLLKTMQERGLNPVYSPEELEQSLHLLAQQRVAEGKT